ncbi:large conductance mechanosensitive channel protein MscL [Chlorogloeopsis fritschii PCC 9212]|uniref:Large-conductance mechanosensitive channel n=1 Tax=Chlorogloeopsis fritschii PCC 6912 TaxID=211165 RepID=A0A433N4X8_CHLFR|nr:large conductance mechanosensitive channel protein MscL [Chlorogloeopsis fritschii]MBF2004113.1 large conductance mechanosensitive channel protein MscL [Chlorogloeopsis fritschii C42_A2020_084]RUR76449.1 large-conductance mechanosensitive channel [Chlorogloeopsis fritschii PCC 6912]
MAVGRNSRNINGFIRDFREFALKGSVMDLAIGVVIGAAFGKIVTSFTEDIIMPLLNPLLAFTGTDWRTFGIPVGKGKIALGSFLGNVVDFLIIAFALYLAIRAIARFKRKEEMAPPAPTEKECPYCLEKIPLAATRCRACTSELAPTVERM